MQRLSENDGDIVFSKMEITEKNDGCKKCICHHVYG